MFCVKETGRDQSQMSIGEIPMSTSEIKIYTTFDSFDADQVIATLEYYDIPSVKRIRGSGQYIGILMGHMTTHEIDVYVAEEAVDRAVDILTETGFLQEMSEDGQDLREKS